MRAATIHEIKQELLALKSPQLVELSLRLGKFKKENKELLTYLLFEAQDEAGYVTSIRQEMDELFADMNMSQLYFAKKSLRKIVRIINKYCRYSTVKETEIELRLHFCQLLKESGIQIGRNPVINNLFHAQLKKIGVLIASLHEDLQYDYLKTFKQLS